MQTSAKIGVLILIAIFLIPAVAAEDALDWYTKAQNAAGSGDYTDAVTYYNDAISLNPTYDAAYAGEAVALNALGQYSAALTAANQALAIRQSPTALGARADALFYEDQYSDAIDAYLNYTSVVFNQYSAYCNLAYSYVQENETSQALAAYSQCTNLNPNDPLVWNQIGLLDMGNGQYSLALTAFNKATGLTTGNAEIWNDKGEAQAALGQYQDAIDSFNTALSINPNYADAIANRQAAMGKGQQFTSSNYVPPTIGPWYLGGVAPNSTITVVPTQNITVIETTLPSVSVVISTPPMTTVPVATRTTFSPLSGVWACAGLAVAILVISMRKHSRKP